jgi:hypothetical protein
MKSTEKDDTPREKVVRWNARRPGTAETASANEKEEGHTRTYGTVGDARV